MVVLTDVALRMVLTCFHHRSNDFRLQKNPLKASQIYLCTLFIELVNANSLTFFFGKCVLTKQNKSIDLVRSIYACLNTSERIHI